MYSPEAKIIANRLEAYTDAHRCSWAEAMEQTGLPDPDLMDNPIDRQEILQTPENNGQLSLDEINQIATKSLTRIVQSRL